MANTRVDRLRIGIESLWFVVLAGVVALDPSFSRPIAIAILASSAVFQVAEPFVLRPLLRRYFAGALALDALSVAVKLALATALVSATGGAESRYHLMYYVPVLSGAVAFGLAGTIVTAALASLSYYSFAYFADPDFTLPFINRGDLALRMIFLFLVATVVNRFVTLERAQREKLSEAERSLERSGRLASLGQLAAGLAHEIRNPLGVIQGSAELLQKQVEGNAQGKELAAMMVHEAKRLNATVTQVLDFAKPQIPSLERCDLREPAKRAIALVADRARQGGVDVRLETVETPAFARADSGQIQQAVLNLCLNGLDATPAGGALFVQVRVTGAGSEIRVSDTGKGIAAKDLERIFDPFFTTRADGTGLGLSIVHRIMELHGGSVTAGSTPGPGAWFLLRFPPETA